MQKFKQKLSLLMALVMVMSIMVFPTGVSFASNMFGGALFESDYYTNGTRSNSNVAFQPGAQISSDDGTGTGKLIKITNTGGVTEPTQLTLNFGVGIYDLGYNIVLYSFDGSGGKDLAYSNAFNRTKLIKSETITSAGTHSMVLSGEPLALLISAFRNGHTIAIGTDRVEHITFSSISLSATYPPLSSDLTVTTKATHYVVNNIANTIVSNDTVIKGNTTVDTLINNLNLPSGYKLVGVSVPQYMPFAASELMSNFASSAIGTKAGSSNLSNNDKLWIVAENGTAFKHFNINVVPLNTSTTITSNDTSKSVVDMSTNTITSDPSVFNWGTAVSVFLANLSKHQTATWKVLPKGTQVHNLTAYNNAEGRFVDEPIEEDDILAIKAEDDSIRVFTLKFDLLSSNNTAVTSKATHYTVGANTIAGNTTVISTNNMVSDFIGNLNLPAHSSYKVMTSVQAGVVTTENQFNAIVGRLHNEYLLTNTVLVVKAQDGTIGKYTVNVLNGNATVTTVNNRHVIDNIANTISAGGHAITDAQFVGNFLNSLILPANSTYKVVSSGVRTLNMADVNSAISNSTFKLDTDLLVPGDKLIVRAQDGLVARVYALNVTHELSSDASISLQGLSIRPDDNRVNNAIIFSANTIIYGTTPVSTILNNLTKGDANATVKAVSGNTVINSVNSALNAQSVANTTTLDNNLRLVVVAENGISYARYGIVYATLLNNESRTIFNVTPSSYSNTLNVGTGKSVSYMVKLATEPEPTVMDLVMAPSPVNSNHLGLATFSKSSLLANTDYKVYIAAFDSSTALTHIGNYAFKTAQTVVVPPVVVPPVVVPTPPSGGGGGGGGGGGSSSNDEPAAKPSTPPSNNPATPVPTPTPKPTSTKIDVTIGGVKESLGLMSTGVGKDGLTTTLVTPETQSFIDKIKKHSDSQLTKGQSNQKLDVSVIVPENSSSIKQAMIDSNSVKSLVSNSVNLKVDTQLGSIILSNEALKSIQKSNSETVSLMMSVQNALPSVKSSLETFMKARGSDLMTVSGEIVDFSMSALDLSGKSTVLDTFETFVSKTLKANKDLTTGVVLGGDGSFHTVPTFVEGRGTANIVGRINSLTNSNYTLIKVDRKFKDISGNKYEASILNLANRLIVEGTTQDAFNPSGKVTRAEFMTMVTKALGMFRGEMGKFKFDDMTAVSGLNIGISVAADKGLVKGYGNNILKPNQTITSEEMASILNNIVTKYGTEKVDTVSGGVTVEGWYKEAVKQSTAYGYIEDFKLGKEMTRAESAYAIEKLLKSLKLID